MTTATLPSGTGIVSTYSYDDADRLTGITHVKGGSTTIASVAYTLDDVGNRTQRVDQQGTHSYSYDDLYRLTSVTYPGPSTTNYAFDAFGNRTSMTVAGNTTIRLRRQRPHHERDAAHAGDTLGLPRPLPSGPSVPRRPSATLRPWSSPFFRAARPASEPNALVMLVSHWPSHASPKKYRPKSRKKCPTHLKKSIRSLTLRICVHFL